MMYDLRYASPSIPGVQALSCENDFSFEAHIHSGYVIWVNSSGCEHFSLGRKTEILMPGSVSVIEPGVVHANRPAGDGARHLRSLYLEQEFFHQLETMYVGSSTGKLLLPTAVFKSPICWQALIMVHEAIISECDRMVVEQHALSLFQNVFQDCSSKQRELQNCNGEDKRLGKLVEYMRENISGQLSLNELAELVGCSSYHVIRLFREAKGMSPHAYLIQLRLETARQQLDSGKQIGDVAHLTGFSDQSHLTRKFKQRYGLTPGRYLAQRVRV